MVKRCLILVIALLPAPPTASAATLQPKLQVAILRKILLYNDKLKGKTDIQLALIHRDGQFETHRQFFEQAKIACHVISSKEFQADMLAGVDIVFYLPGGYTASIARAAISRGILTVTNDTDLTTAGRVSVGLGVESNKPLILIHLQRLADENHHFSSQLLALAKVIK